ncbi:MAG: helix-turn-helix transcriptional regulator [Ruthenibacterium sp.]
MYYFFGTKLRDWRIENEMTQERLAELLQLSTRTVQLWESGRGLPGIYALLDTADVMGVSIDWLLDRTQNWHITGP